MRVLNVIDIVFYRTILAKIYCSLGVAYDFVAPEDPDLPRQLRDNPPDAVLVQDSYMSLPSAVLAGQVREAAAGLGRAIPILYLLPRDGDHEPAPDIPAGPDLHPVNRLSLGRVLRGLRDGLSGPKPPKRAILVVDAGRSMLHVIRAGLSKDGFHVVAAHDADQALALCRRQDFELVLTSVQLPGRSGLDLCRALKEENSGRYLPVVILSSSDDPLDMETAFNCGADDYLLKSFTPGMLADKMSEHLDVAERKRHNKILVVDDNKLIRELLRHSFIKAGLNVLTAADGREALDIAQAHLPDVVVTDIEMPVMDGYGLCEG